MLFLIKHWKYSLLMLFIASLTFGIKEEIEGFIIAGAVGGGLMLYFMLMKMLINISPKWYKDRLFDSKALNDKSGFKSSYEEFSKIVNQNNSLLILNKIVLVVFILIVLCPFVMPSWEKRATKHDEIVIMRINEELVRKNFDQVSILIPLLKKYDNTVKYKSILQSKLFENSMIKISSIIEEKNFATAKIELAKLKWKFASGPDGYYWYIEKNYCIHFIELLKSTNALLPTNYQIKDIEVLEVQSN